MNTEKKSRPVTKVMQIVKDNFMGKKIKMPTRESEFAKLLKMTKEMYTKLSYTPVEFDTEEKKLDRFYTITTPVHDFYVKLLETKPNFNKKRHRDFFFRLKEFFEITETGADQKPNLYEEDALAFIKAKKGEMGKILRSLKKR